MPNEISGIAQAIAFVPQVIVMVTKVMSYQCTIDPVSTSANEKADKKAENMPAHDEMHTKAPSSICCRRQSAQLALSSIS